MQTSLPKLIEEALAVRRWLVAGESPETIGAKLGYAPEEWDKAWSDIFPILMGRNTEFKHLWTGYVARIEQSMSELTEQLSLERAKTGPRVDVVRKLQARLRNAKTAAARTRITREIDAECAQPFPDRRLIKDLIVERGKFAQGIMSTAVTLGIMKAQAGQLDYQREHGMKARLILDALLAGKRVELPGSGGEVIVVNPVAGPNGHSSGANGHGPDKTEDGA